ncbi:hypothetical protein P7C73_g4231, partial [Tremellales sp. Uapishka_1]
MKLALVALAVAGVVSAQNSTLIPSNVTTTCSTFLTKIDSDTTLQNCISPLINVTSSFSPTSTSNLTTDTINYTLASLCKNTDGCSDTTVRQWLSDFYTACSTELTSTTGYNPQVRELYDIVYVINPLKNAVCAIDSANQDYCVNEIRASLLSSANSTAAGTSNTTLLSLVALDTTSPVAFAAANLYISISSTANSLTRRFLSTISPRADAQSVNIITPNATTYKTTNLPFLFLRPSSPSAALCTPCTREIMVAYIEWEYKVPYALGLSASPILGGQSALWSAIKSTCGTTFSTAIVSQAGSLSANTTSTSAASERVWTSVGGLTSVVVLAGAVAMLA